VSVADIGDMAEDSEVLELEKWKNLTYIITKIIAYEAVLVACLGLNSLLPIDSFPEADFFSLVLLGSILKYQIISIVQ